MKSGNGDGSGRLAGNRYRKIAKKMGLSRDKLRDQRREKEARGTLKAAVRSQDNRPRGVSVVFSVGTMFQFHRGSSPPSPSAALIGRRLSAALP